jgi:hypothetical protein
MRRTLLLGVLCLCFAASEARADRVLIGFDFSGSQISVLGGVIQIPPGGSIQASGATMSFVADGTGGLVQAGPVGLSLLSLSATVDQTIGAIVAISGNVRAEQIGVGNGMLTAGLANAVFMGNLLLSLDVLVNCTPGAICNEIATFPLSLAGPQTLSNLGTLPIANVNDLGNASIMATLTITFAGLTAQLELVGTEVSRSFVVPEPSTAVLFGLGVLGLSGYGWHRTRR